MTLVAERKETRVISKPAASPAAEKMAVGMSPCVVPALLTGAMLWACHFPLAWGWLGWVALVPFLTLTRATASAKRIYWSAYLAGLAFFVPVLQFMRVADPRMYATWLMLAFYCALYFPVALWLIRMLDRKTRLPLCLSVPMVWVGLEWIRSFLLTGFAWYYLGHAQHQFASLIQVADLGGVYAISFVVAAVNAWLCDLAFHIPVLRDRFRWREAAIGHASQVVRTSSGLWLQGGAVALLLVGAVLYGAWRLEQTQFVRGPRVALVQTNVPQSVRNDPDYRSKLVAQMIVQNGLLPYLACLHEPLPDLIVWPETSYLVEAPDERIFSHFIELSPKLPLEKVEPGILHVAEVMRSHFRHQLAALYPTQHLLGINTLAFDEAAKMTHYSSALMVDREGTPTGRFDKQHRVPFGEYVPLVDWLPFMKAFAPYGPDSDYSIAPGKTLTRFPLRDFHFGALVCFEDSDPILARGYAQTTRDGKPVDFLINMSNDGWFHGTSEHEEHLVVSRFRAIESRRALVRAVNKGISTIVDPNGRVLKPKEKELERPDIDHPSANPAVAKAQGFWEKLGFWRHLKNLEKSPNDGLTLWEVQPNANGTFDELTPGEYAQYKDNAGVLIATVPIDNRVSVYSQWGDWLPIACWGICLSALGWAALRGRKRVTPAVL